MNRILILAICFMAAGVGSFAAEGKESYKVDFGTEISHIKYKEPGVMKEEGVNAFFS